MSNHEQISLPPVGTVEPVGARDCWQMAKEWSCAPGEACRISLREAAGKWPLLVGEYRVSKGTSGVC